MRADEAFLLIYSLERICGEGLEAVPFPCRERSQYHISVGHCQQTLCHDAYACIANGDKFELLEWAERPVAAEL